MTQEDNYQFDLMKKDLSRVSYGTIHMALAYLRSSKSFGDSDFSELKDRFKEGIELIVNRCSSKNLVGDLKELREYALKFSWREESLINQINDKFKAFEAKYS